jgi:hypothetical protein
MHKRVPPLAAGALLLALGGCSQVFPEPVSGPQSVIVVTYQSSTETFALDPETLTTLHDLRTMQGAAAKIYANATVKADYGALTQSPPNSDNGLASAVVVNGGQPVDFNYFRVQSGIYPADGDALNVATAYYELETAYLFFQGMSLQLPAVPTYYFPDLTVNAGGPLSVTDLGTTDPWLGVFVIPSFKSATWEPPALQPGVVAYEYAQAVFAQQVFGSPGPSFLDVAAAQTPALAMTYAPTMNIVRSLDAGMADFFAAIIVDDPDFVHTSGATVDPNRSLMPSSLRCLKGISNDYLTATRDTYDPHPLGSIISSVLYDSYTQPNTPSTYPASIGGTLAKFGQYLASLQPQLQASPLTLEALVDNFVTWVDSASQPRLCAVFIDRLGLDPALLQNCGDAITLTGPTCASQ